MIRKLLGMRIFGDENGKTNLSLHDIEGSLLLISQFTLYADCRKGNRPSFIKAGNPELANNLYEYIIAKCKEEIAELSQEVDAQKADMERQLESAAQEQAEFEKLESWADLYDNCTFEAKKMIVSQLIKAVYVYRDYRLEVEFRVSFEDFRRLCVGCEPNGGRITTVESA